MFRSLLYLAFAMVASSAIATAMATKHVPITCAGVSVDAPSSVAMQRALAHQTCVASVTKP